MTGMLVRVIVGVVPSQVLGESRPFTETASFVIADGFPFVYVHVRDFLHLITVEAFEFYRADGSGHDVGAFEYVEDIAETHKSTPLYSSLYQNFGSRGLPRIEP